MLKFQNTEVLPPEKVKKSEKLKGTGITYIQKVIKGETFLVMAQSAVEIEDEFSSLYFSAQHKTNLFLQPPFEPTVLLNLVQTNNVLNQCIEAMEVNIDGTGVEFVAGEEGKNIDKEEEKIARAFFEEPYPNKSLVSIRRKLRRQMESVGYGFLEVLRNMAGKVVGFRNVETSHVRMVKLDDPIQVKKKIMRNGQEVEMTLWERERRFAQRVALKQLIYYREFGSSRQINRETGEWETPTNPVPLEKRGTELLVFGIHPDTQTPYFLPRWINELPSVVGSRNAEEQNLQFLDAGGMPPAIIFIQGGTLIKDTSDQLKTYLSGVNKNKNRAVVVEVQSSSGSLDTAAKVDVKVERFGSAQSQDAMFMKYDEATEEHVRIGFRLPPLFLGKAQDYNFATAQVAYMVAEAQVFGPERTDFDEVMNKTIIKELGLKTLKMKSKPITLKDVATQLEALGIAKDVATRESYLKEINTSAGMSLKLAAMPNPNVASDQEHPGQPTLNETPHEALPASVRPPMVTAPQPLPPPESKPTPKQLHEEEFTASAKEKAKAQFVKKTAIELIDLAHDYATVRGLVKKQELSPERELVVLEEVDQLEGSDKQAFNRLLAQFTIGSDDPELADVIAAVR